VITPAHIWGPADIVNHLPVSREGFHGLPLPAAIIVLVNLVKTPNVTKSGRGEKDRDEGAAYPGAPLFPTANDQHL